MRQKQNEAYWQEQLDGWRQSGLTQSAYCVKHGLNVKTFNRWHNKTVQRQTTKEASLTLVPVQVAELGARSMVRIISPGGWRIELSDASVATLNDVVRCLP